jgi:hypothetical protein
VEKEILALLCWEIRVTTPQAMLDELLYCLPEARSTPEQCAYSDHVIKAAQLYLDVASMGRSRNFRIGDNEVFLHKNYACSEWAYLQYPPSTLAVSAFKCGLIDLDFDDLNETVDIACNLTSVCQVAYIPVLYLNASPWNGITVQLNIYSCTLSSLLINRNHSVLAF